MGLEFVAIAAVIGWAALIGVLAVLNQPRSQRRYMAKALIVVYVVIGLLALLALQD